MVGMRLYLNQEKTSLTEKVTHTSAIAQESQDNWIRENHLAVQSLSILVGNPDTTPLSTIQNYAETFTKISNVFSGWGC